MLTYIIVIVPRLLDRLRITLRNFIQHMFYEINFNNNVILYNIITCCAFYLHENNIKLNQETTKVLYKLILL